MQFLIMNTCNDKGNTNDFINKLIDMFYPVLSLSFMEHVFCKIPQNEHLRIRMNISFYHKMQSLCSRLNGSLPNTISLCWVKPTFDRNKQVDLFLHI